MLWFMFGVLSNFTFPSFFGFKATKASTCFFPRSSIVFVCFPKAFTNGE